MGKQTLNEEFKNALENNSDPKHYRTVNELFSLVEQGADINIVTKFNGTFLSRLVELSNNDESKIKKALQLGADINKGYANALMTAIMNKKQDIALMLIEKGADINHSDKMSETPLILASYHGCNLVVKRLLELDVDITAKNFPFGSTAYEQAYEKNHFEIMKMIKEKSEQNSSSEREAEIEKELDGFFCMK